MRISNSVFLWNVTKHRNHVSSNVERLSSFRCKHRRVNVYRRASRRHSPPWWREEVRRRWVGGRVERAEGWLVVLSAYVIRDPVFRRGDVFIAQFFPSYRPYTESYVRQGINIGKICCYYWGWWVGGDAGAGGKGWYGGGGFLRAQSEAITYYNCRLG